MKMYHPKIINKTNIYCRERREVTFNFRPFIFNGIPMLLICLHGDFSINVSQDSDFTELKLVVQTYVFQIS